MTEKERMLSGQLYKLPDSELNALLFRSRKLRRLIAECKEGEIDRKNSLYKQLLGCVGKKFWIGSPFYCDYGVIFILVKILSLTMIVLCLTFVPLR